MATKPRYRLMIEGIGTEWVTDTSLEYTTTDGRVRRDGLLYDGLEIRETINVRESEIKARGMSFKIVSRYADGVFGIYPEYSAMLAADIDEDDTTLTINNDTGIFAVDDVIHIGTEAMLVTSVTTVTIGVTRQYWDTQMQGHYVDVGRNAENVPIYLTPPSIEGRRAYLFQYDAGDTSDHNPLFDFSSYADGRATDTTDTVIWRGIIARQPKLDKDGITWIVDTEPITYVLEQEIAREEVTLKVAGVYLGAYSGCYIKVSDDGAGEEETTTICGFFPSNGALISAINSSLSDLNDALTYPQTSIELSWNSNDGYRLDLEMATTRDYNVIICCPAIGMFGVFNDQNYWYQYDVNHAVYYTNLAGLSSYFKLVLKEDLFYDGGDTYNTFFSPLNKLTDALPVIGWPPRYVLPNTEMDRCVLGTPSIGLWGGDEFVTELRHGVGGGDADTYPSMRLYINDDPGNILAVGGLVYISGTYKSEEYSVLFDITAKSTHAVYGTTFVDLHTSDPNFYASLPVTSDAEVVMVYDYGTETNVGGFLGNVVSASVDANKGGTPHITYADIDPISLAGTAFYLPPLWSFSFSSPVVLLDIVREHCKLHGLYMHLNSVGRIAFAIFNIPTTRTGAVDLALDSTNIVTNRGSSTNFPRWEPSKYGIVGTVEMSRGYNWEDDSFDDSMLITVRDVNTISTHKNRSRGVAKIEAKGNPSITGVELENAFIFGGRLYLSSHSKDYDCVTLGVTRDVFDSVVCGSIVTVTSPHILDSTDGTRGVANRNAMVLAKRYSLDPKRGAAGEIELRIERVLNYGYAPSMLATAVSTVGMIYTFTVDTDYFAPGGYDDSSFFVVGDQVIVYPFEEVSPALDSGSISAINSSTSVSITMDTTIAASTSGKWVIDYRADNGSLGDNQDDYCYVADSNGLLHDNSPGRRFV